jgi:hypothetical protein
VRLPPNSSTCCLCVAAPRPVHGDARPRPSTVIYMVRPCSALLWCVAPAAHGHKSTRCFVPVDCCSCALTTARVFRRCAAVWLIGIECKEVPAAAQAGRPHGTPGHDGALDRSPSLKVSVAFDRGYCCEWLCIRYCYAYSIAAGDTTLALLPRRSGSQPVSLCVVFRAGCFERPPRVALPACPR